MNCPLCSAKADEGATECPSCGALFAKLRQRAAREKEQARAALALAEAKPPSPALNLWRIRLASAAVVIAWMIGFGLYFRTQMKKTPQRRRATALTDQSTMRIVNPATGKLESVPVHVSPRANQAAPEQMPKGEAGPPPGTPPYDPEFDD
jgi:anti-sigma-K factor RskA